MHPVEVFLTKGGTYFAWIVQGLPETIKVAICAVLFALVFGLVVALVRMTRWRALRLPAVMYVEFFRGTPAFVQLFVIYFGLPDLGYQPSPFQAAIVGLGLNGAAYFSEIYRAGIESIHKGQMEAALTLGMTPIRAMRYIILPQAIRSMLPPITTVASGRCTSDPALVDSAMGRKPTPATNAVISTGRNLVSAPWRIASSSD